MSFAAIERRARKDVDECVAAARAVVLPRYGMTLGLFRTPLPPSVLALYIAHESNGVRWVLTKYPEVGLAQLTCRKGDNEVRLFNVDPLDPASNIWGAQQGFWQQRQILASAPALRFRKIWGFPFAACTAMERATILWCGRSIGAGCVRGVMRRAHRLDPKSNDVRGLMYEWLARPDADTSAFDASQTTDQVRLRYLVGSIAVDAARAGRVMTDLPADWSTAPPRARTDLVKPMPREFETRMKYYRNLARGEGPRPTGPWKE